MEQMLLRRGQRVVLEVVNEDQVRRNTFVVEEVQPTQIQLTPLTEGDVLPLYAPGVPVRGYFPTPVRAYQFESVVRSCQFAPNPSLVLDPPQNLRPVQRRRFFRVRVLHRAQLQPLPVGHEEKTMPLIEAFATNINAGGIGVWVELRRLPTALTWRLHQRFRLSIFLPPVEREFPEGLKVETIGELIWMSQSDRYLRLGIAFTDIDRRTQERIIAWCFAYQRRLLQRGLWSDEI